jgi:hypothetical protein
MDIADVAVATMTLVRDEREDQHIRQALVHLARHSLRVAVTDAGSAEGFTRALRDLPLFTVAAASRPPGLIAQVRTSLNTASEWDTRFLLYTEPDKSAFFEQWLMPFIGAAPATEDVGVVMACRSEGSLATFPVFQQYTEATINRLCAELIGKPADYSYGPFLLNRRLVPYLSDLGPEVGWGWRHYLFGLASRLGLRLVAIVGEFECPVSQREEQPGDRLHRIRQLGENIQGLLLSQTRVLST